MKQMGGGEFAIIGGGPAGLSAAHTLATEGRICPLVLEKDGHVGGLAKTVEYRGFRCDIGGHRFFTKSPEVEAFWREMLPGDLLRRPRLSRIYYGGKFFDYPLRIGNALSELGWSEGARIVASFAMARMLPRQPEITFEDWVSNRFGCRLFSIFFRSYTEKVWGIPCSRLSADWAAQRIRNLDLARAVLSAVGIGRGREVASLIEEFDYPRLGPGQMYEAIAARTMARGGRVLLHHAVEAVHHEGEKVTGLEVNGPDGPLPIDVDRVISTMPITELVQRMKPEPPPAVTAAAAALTYRSIITVNLMVERPQVVPDTWLYAHDENVVAGRLQFYKNWSQAMVPNPNWSSVGLEYFVTEGDYLWSLPDSLLIEIGRKDLATLGLAKSGEIFDGFVARYAKSYPVYAADYGGKLAILRGYLSQLRNLECAGRYGQFRYNNMDHSILTGMLAARKLCGEQCDPWNVNVDVEFHEHKPIRRPLPPVRGPIEPVAVPVLSEQGVGRSE